MKRLIALLLFAVMLGSSCAYAESTVVYASHDGVSIYCRNGKYGFVRDDGEELHPPVFDEVSIFRNECSIVCRDGLWGVIDQTGKTVVPCEYDYVRLVYASGSTKRFIVSNAQGCGVLNEAGEPICELIYDSILGYVFESAIVEMDGLMGLIDLQGDTIVSPRWEWSYYMTDGWALVSFEEKDELRYSFVNSDNERMKQDYSYAEPFSEGVAFVMDEEYVNFINVQGEVVFDKAWDNLHDSCSQGLIGVLENGLWGYCSKSGEVMIPPAWDKAMPFSEEGLALVQVNGMYGFIDKSGQIAIEPVWTTAFTFRNGYALVGDGKHYGLIDQTGAICIPLIWDEMGPRSEGLVAVKDANGLWGFADLTGEQKISCRFKFVISGFENGCARVIEPGNDRVIWINTVGDIVCP